MSLGDWIQTLSLLLVALAFFLGILQLREVGKQSISLNDSLKQTSYESAQSGHSGYLASWLKEDPAILEWHLRTRGYKTADFESNKKTIYLLLKLENQERNVLNRNQGTLSSEVWLAWRAVLEADAKLPEFQELWPIARQYYAHSLVAEVDGILTRQSPS